jgi:hypothetical protein
MNRAHIGNVLNFDLCDLQKVGQIKNPGIISCTLIRCTYDPVISSGVIALFVFSVLALWCT